MSVPAVWRRLLRLASVITALVALVSLVPGDGWLTSLFSNLRMQILIASTVLCLLSLAGRHWRQAAVLGGASVWTLLVMLPQFSNLADNTSRQADALSIVSFNLSFSSADYDRVQHFLAGHEADVIVLQEYTFDWQRELSALSTAYPHYVDEPRPDAFGIALFSRLPLRNARIERFPGRGTPYARATVEHDGREFEFFGLHLAWPMTPNAFAARNLQLTHLADELMRSPGIPLACGDFNLTSWSPWFSRLQEQSKLSGIQSLSRHQATWPSLFGPLGIAIDHCLVGQPASIARKSVGPALGSDHRLTVFDVAVQQVVE